MPQHVMCNVREHDVLIIKSRLKLRDCIFFSGFWFSDFPFSSPCRIVDRIAQISVFFYESFC